VNPEEHGTVEALQFEKNWRRVSWALLDKSLPVVFGVGFLLLVMRTLPADELALQAIASTVLLTAAQLLRFTLLVPVIKHVAEGRDTARVAATGALLYAGASVLVAFVLALGAEFWASLFRKPALGAVLLPSAVLLTVGSLRDAGNATLEGERRLRALFWADFGYYAVALAALAAWYAQGAPRTAVAVQWIQAGAAGLGSLLTVVVVRRSMLARPALDAALRLLLFGRFSFGFGLASTLGQHADTLLAGALMDAPGVASYHVAKQFFRIFNVLAQAITQVLMPLVSRLQSSGRERDVRVLYEKSVCFLQLGLVPVIAALLVAAPFVYQLFYGERYAESVGVFRVLVLSGLTLPFASVGSPFLVGLGQVRSLLWITWTVVVVGVALALLWIPRFGAVGAAAALLVASVVGMVLRTWVLQRILGFALRDVAGRSRDAAAFLRRRLGFS
jgi:O-antigen/teichoic acid export membrane protein